MLARLIHQISMENMYYIWDFLPLKFVYSRYFQFPSSNNQCRRIIRVITKTTVFEHVSLKLQIILRRRFSPVPFRSSNCSFLQQKSQKSSRIPPKFLRASREKTLKNLDSPLKITKFSSRFAQKDV